MDRQRSHPVQPVLTLAAVLLCAACATAPARPEHAKHSTETVALPGPAAAAYVTQSANDRPALDDKSGVLARAFAESTRTRGVQLTADPRLTALSHFIADHVASDGSLPSQAAIDLAARHLGLVEPTPHFVVVGADAESGIEERLRQDIEALLAEREYSHFGGVAQARDGMTLYVAALVFRFVDLSPVPRTLVPGESITLEGTLTHGHTQAELAVTEPDGRVVRSSPSSGSALNFRVPALTRGVYRVEVLGQGPQGITVVANFPVYVGETPPSDVEIAPSDAGTMDAERGAAALLEMINSERARAGLPALALDATLSRVADAHVADMLEHGFVAHTSPTTGSAADRAARAGVRTSIVLENIGRGYSLREVHEGLMSSPGHRGNILHELVTQVGIGLRVTPESGHAAYLVTELFTRVTPKLAPDAAAKLVAAINARRTQKGLRELRVDPVLATLAQRNTELYFASPPPTDASIMQRVREDLAHARLVARSVGAMLTVVSSTQELAHLDGLLEPGLQWIGVGITQGTRSDTPQDALCAILLLGQ